MSPLDCLIHVAEWMNSISVDGPLLHYGMSSSLVRTHDSLCCSVTRNLLFFLIAIDLTTDITCTHSFTLHQVPDDSRSMWGRLYGEARCDHLYTNNRKLRSLQR
ncbi:hypothetical protein BD410DRAFT_794730 [Rickenella mellea]|uniref:Uncharacterized protein n=1 Tax=Rickenella mellea TaxID=50990 RepID=A0A4Y7PPF6_9AGAM|nr:hypothetical protein BD410DRAFT_794730 [Rickenella mellea]